MKQILLAVAVSTSVYCSAQQSVIIPGTAAFYAAGMADNVNQVFITDQNEGGLFYKYTGPALVDSGVIISDAAGHKYKRQFDEGGPISPLWWGAKTLFSS